MDHLLDNGAAIYGVLCVAVRTDFVVEAENDGDSERLNKLATFQLKMIEHAMTCEEANIYSIALRTRSPPIP